MKSEIVTKTVTEEKVKKKRGPKPKAKVSEPLLTITGKTLDGLIK